MATEIEKITPPKSLTQEQRALVFHWFFRRLAQHRNTARLYSMTECYSISSGQDDDTEQTQQAFEVEINNWGQALLEKAWIVCHGEDKEHCPKLDPLADTAVTDLDKLPPAADMARVLNTILFLDITISKQYSAHTRNFLSTLGSLDEDTIITTLKNPEHAIGEAQKKAEVTRTEHAARGKVLRNIGIGFGAIAGGVLVGVTGGLAAPLVGAGIATVLGWLGIGGSILGLIASGLAGSSIVCGALFGAYGAKSTAAMVERHTKEVSDLAILPVRNNDSGYKTLGVRLCISGWLNDDEDVTAPWTVFEGDDTLALQWEMKALHDLSNALMASVRTQAMKYVQGEVLKRTVFAGLMSSLAPLALLKIGNILDNPWMNARALAIKTGAVLGELLEHRVFGNRPVSLAGYSLGSLVIFEALKYLATLAPSKTMHLIQDVFLFGTPVNAAPQRWASIRRVVSGRLVNGYSSDDYVLAVLCRASDTTWEVAGLQKVDVKGVENILCVEVKGHTMWRWMIGKYLEMADAPGIAKQEVTAQIEVMTEKEKENAQEYTTADNATQEIETGHSGIST